MDEGTTKTAPAAAAAANNNRWSWKVKKTSLSAALQAPSSPSPPSPSSSASPPPSTNSFCFTPNKSSHGKYLVELAHDSKRRKDPSHTAEMVELSADTKRLAFCDGVAEMKLRSLFTAYEDLVQQHAIVAEEAVLGWREAEVEADDLRKQLIAEKETMEMMKLEVRVEKGIMAEKVEKLEVRIEKELGEKVARLEKLHRDEMEARIRAEARAELLQARLELVEREHEKCAMYVDVLDAVKEELVRCRTNNVGAMQKKPEDMDRRGSAEDGAGDGSSLKSSECKCARIEEQHDAASYSTKDAMPLCFVDEDDDCDMGSSESWAVALMSQLAHIDRDRGIARDHARASSLADEFVETEEELESPDPTSIGRPRGAPAEHTDGEDETISDGVGRTCESVGSICREISSMMRLARAENELNQSQLENLEMRGALTTVGRRLIEMLRPAAPDTGDDPIHGRHRSESTIHDLLTIVSKHSGLRSGPGLMTMMSEEVPEVRDIRWWSPNAESTSDPSDI